MLQESLQTGESSLWQQNTSWSRADLRQRYLYASTPSGYVELIPWRDQVACCFHG